MIATIMDINSSKPLLLKSRFRFFTILCGLMIMAVQSLSPVHAADNAEAWHPETFTLDNGLEVVVLPDHRAPVVTHMVWYKVGAADEKPGKSGIAHFLEHLMFRGTSNIPPGEFSKTVARHGGQDNAFTSIDYTAYFQRVAVDRLPLVMQMEADRMKNLTLTKELVDPERDVILEERSQRTDNDPAALLAEQMAASLFMAHPYGIPIIGWEHEMRGLTQEDAVEFYKTYYAPNNAVLIVAGDITAETLRPLAEKYYGPLTAEDVPERFRVKEPPHVAPRRIIHHDARVKQPSLRRSYIASSYSTSEGNEAFAIDVLVQLLGVGPTSRLYQKLVVEQGLATSVGAWYWSTTLDYGRVGLYGTPRETTTLDQLEAAIDEVLADLIANGVSEEEVKRAQDNLIADAIYARDSQQSMARMYGAALTTGSTVEDVLSYPDDIRKVTADDVVAAAKRVFEQPSHVTGHLLPEPKS